MLTLNRKVTKYSLSVICFISFFIISAPGYSAAEPISGDYLTGDWGGVRQSMVDKGVTFELGYVADNFYNAAGGLKQDYMFLGNIDTTLDLDMETLLGWTGGQIFLYGLGGHGGAPTSLSGDYQGASNIEADMNYYKLYEAWIQQTIGKFSLLAGMHDLNSEFYVNDPAGLFLSSSMGIGTEMAISGENGPSIFPIAALAIRAKVQATDTIYVMAAVYNAVAGDPANPGKTYADFSFKDGVLGIAEAGLYEEENIKIAAGFWTYGNKVANVQGTAVDQMGYGYYLLFDKTLGKDYSIFFRAGRANPDAYEIEYNIAEGITLSGNLWSRPDDQMGLGITTILPSGKTTGYEAHETAIELTYRFQPVPWFALQPDLQYILNPSMDSTVNDAVAINLRAELAF